MTWRTSVIDSSLSVAAHESRLNDNASYINTTMKVDHFWDDNTSANDGRHNVVQMPNQSSDPTLGTGMKAAVYAKEVTAPKGSVTTDELFLRNAAGIFQISGLQISQSENTVAASSNATVLTVSGNQMGIVMSVRADGSENVGIVHLFSRDDSGTVRIVNLNNTDSSKLGHSVSGNDLRVNNKGSSTTRTINTTIFYVEFD